MASPHPVPVSSPSMALPHGNDYGSFEAHKATDRDLLKKRPGGEEGKPAVAPNSYMAVAGMMLAIGAVCFHLLPCIFLLTSYCSEYGCLGYGCDDQLEFHQCLPCYSNTILARPGDKPSQTRHFFALIAVCVRSPLCFLCLRYAHRQIVSVVARPGSKDAESRIFIFEVLMLMFTLLDITVVYVPNTGSSKPWHILTAFCLMCLWTLVIVPLLASAVSAAQSSGNQAINAVDAVWFVWVLSFSIGIWLLLSWFINRGVQWYVFEWIYVVAQGFQIGSFGWALQSCQLMTTREPDEAG
eukprot:TRINITY_DN57832_c0_g1_i1.p1 TRINITY_DN57832_c0_g1~~TRINITY_DN57832_c0_g1_i1.p1  ORF type:complete len:297 (+),score=38.24 TRINITY_DN57832_c0_g1_i1:81-971(+)